jgi:IclR family acetate operon transcriptional repressor
MSQPRANDVPAGSLGTVRNAVMLLDLLADGAPYQQLAELAERSSLSLPTVHRLLRSLGVAGLVEQDPESLRYGLGPELVRLSERYLDRLPVFRAAAPYLVELRDSTKATVLAAVFARGWTVYVDRVDGGDGGGVFREPVRMRPALETAAGRLLAARRGPLAWKEAVETANGQSFTADERKRWADAPFLVLAHDGNPAEVAGPVTSSDGKAVGSLVATGQSERHTEEVLVEQVAPQLARAAAAASRALSHG